VELDIPSMGCAACINKIDSTITGCNGVLSGRSWLEDDPRGGEQDSSSRPPLLMMSMR
jgi:hypothetical protein